MMRRGLLVALLASFVAMLAAGADQARGAIRVTISDGSETQVFYADANAAAFVTSIGDYDVLLQTTLTNFPGADSGTFLAQTVNLTDSDPPNGGVLPQLNVFAEVIEAVGGVTTGLVTGGNLAAVQGASLALFTAPSGAVLEVRSDVATADIQRLASGVVRNITTVDGISLASLPNPINATIEAETSMFILNPDGEFTLTSLVTLLGANRGISGVTISASSGVFGTDEQVPIIPEPGSLAVWGLGALGLAWVVRRRLSPAARR